MLSPIINLPAAAGRDYVVGDLHGMLHKLYAILSGSNFDPTKDRVISCGDLINRGPKSLETFLLINEPWFYAVRGNHEEMLARYDEPAYYRCLMTNGGDWLLTHTEEEVMRLAKLANTLPYALTFDSGSKLVGVVHANIPTGMSWKELTDIIQSDSLSDKARNELIKSLLWEKAKLEEMTPSRAAICDIDEVYFGHTVFPVSRHIANRHYIDTGAAYQYSTPTMGNVLTCHIWSAGNYIEVIA